MCTGYFIGFLAFALVFCEETAGSVPANRNAVHGRHSRRILGNRI